MIKRRKNIVLCFLIFIVVILSLLATALMVQKTKAEEAQAQSSFFTAVKNAEIIENYQAPEHIGDYKGIFIKSLDNGDSVVELTHDLDLRVFEKKDVLLKFIPITTAPIDKEENREIDALNITLTDVEDESRNININVIASENGITPDRYGGVYPYGSYVKAAGDGQRMTGYYKQTYYTHEYYGTGVRTNFFGRVREGMSQKDDINPLTINYDYNLSQVHAAPASSNTMVADLTDSIHMDGEWDGFLSGKVRVTITATSSSYHNKNCGFLILQMGNIDFSKQSWTDIDAPRLTVDLQEYTQETLPNGQIFRKYPLFDAKAYDLFDASYGKHACEKKVDIRVIRIADNTECLVANNAFVPQAIGKYRIIYSATDASGNRAEKVFEINVMDVYDKMSYRWETPLQDNITVGKRYILPNAQVENGYGSIDIITEIFFTIDGSKVPLDKGGFIPEKQGEYCIKVTVKDYLERESIFEYYINANVSNKPILKAKPSLPFILFVGKETKLPDFDARDYGLLLDDNVDALKEYVIYDADMNELERVKPEETFVPTASYGDEVTIKCTVKSVLYEDSEVMSQKAKVFYNERVYKKGEFFIKDKIDEVAYNYKQENNVTFFFSEEDARLSFGNPLIFENFESIFRIPEKDENNNKLNNYSSFVFTLTDWKDATKQVNLEVEKVVQGEKTEVQISMNGKFVSKSEEDFEDSDIVFSINKFNEVLDETGQVICKINTYSTGDKFEGFSEGLCYLSLQMKGVQEKSAFQVLKIGNHWFTDSDTDYIAPNIGLSEVLQSEQFVGEVCLPGAVASDVLKGKVAVKLHVLSPKNVVMYNGEIDTDSIILQLNIPGTYSVTYMAHDGENIATEKLSIHIYKKEIPNVSLSAEVQKTGKVGQEIKLPGVCYNDYISRLTTIIYVIKPNGSKITLDNNLTFNPERPGTYQVFYYVVEDILGSYNYKMLNYKIEVGD